MSAGNSRAPVRTYVHAYTPFSMPLSITNHVFKRPLYEAGVMWQVARGVASVVTDRMSAVGLFAVSGQSAHCAV